MIHHFIVPLIYGIVSHSVTCTFICRIAFFAFRQLCLRSLLRFVRGSVRVAFFRVSLSGGLVAPPSPPPVFRAYHYYVHNNKDVDRQKSKNKTGVPPVLFSCLSFCYPGMFVLFRLVGVPKNEKEMLRIILKYYPRQNARGQKFLCRLASLALPSALFLSGEASDKKSGSSACTAAPVTASAVPS